MKNLVLHANTTILPLQYDYCLFNTTILPLQYDYCLFNTTILPLQYDYCLFNTTILHLQYDYFAPPIRLLPLQYDCCQIRPIPSQYDLRPSYTTILSLIPLHKSGIYGRSGGRFHPPKPTPIGELIAFNSLPLFLY